MNKYEVLGIVGEGVYGLVLKCRNKETGNLVAIKKFKDSDDDETIRKTTIREVRILRMLQHDNIVSMYEAFRRKGKLYLVFEYVDKNLLEVLQEFANGIPADLVKRYMYQIIQAIHCCHSNGIIHRDIKPENLLVSTKHDVKLCDFGFSRQIPRQSGQMTDYVATRWYRSPELILGSDSYSQDVDMWAVGCLMAEMSTGQPLFPGQNDVDQLFMTVKALGDLTDDQNEILAKNPKFHGLEFGGISQSHNIENRFKGKIWKEGIELMKQCIQIKPSARISASSALQHEYFAGLAPSRTSNRPQSQLAEVTEAQSRQTNRNPARRSKRNGFLKDSKSQSPTPYINQSHRSTLQSKVNFLKSKRSTVTKEDLAFADIPRQASNDAMPGKYLPACDNSNNSMRLTKKSRHRSQEAYGRKKQYLPRNTHGLFNFGSTEDSPKIIKKEKRQFPRINYAGNSGKAMDFVLRRGESRAARYDEQDSTQVLSLPSTKDTFSYYRSKIESQSRQGMIKRPNY